MNKAYAIGCILLLQSTGGGCTATETGNPTATIELDPSNLRTDVVGPPTGGELIATLSGPAGAIVPAGGTLIGTNLDSALPAVRADIESDGSFAISLDVQGSDRIRLLAHRGNEFSEPFDARITSLGAEPLIHRPCVRLLPSAVVRVPSTVRVVNECEAAITRLRGRVRESDSFLMLTDEAALTLQPGEDATLVISGEGAGTVLVDLQAPVAELRAFTVLD